MGLISVALNSAFGTLEDQFKEYFSCEALPKTVFMRRGHKVVNGRTNNNGYDNVISNGSKIILYDNQAAIITDNGQIVDVIMQPGGYEFNKSSQPSIFFNKNIGENLKKSLLETWERFKFAGQPSNEQRIFFFNMQPLTGFTFGSAGGGVPVSTRSRTYQSIKRTITLRYYGDARLQIADPMTFYKVISGNANEYTMDLFNNAYKNDLEIKVKGALSKLSANGLIYFDEVLGGGTDSELSNKIDDLISNEWIQAYGIDIEHLNINPNISESDKDGITKAEDKANEKAAELEVTGNVDDATVDRLAKLNASKTNGNMMGAMMGIGYGAQMMPGMQQGMNMGMMQSNMQNQAQGIKCPKCNTINSQGTKFCSECGEKLIKDTWKCECGAENTGKFCNECGKKKPE